MIPNHINASFLMNLMEITQMFIEVYNMQSKNAKIKAFGSVGLETFTEMNIWIHGVLMKILEKVNKFLNNFILTIQFT